MIYSILAVITAILHGTIVLVLFGGVILAVLNKLKNWPYLEKIYLISAFLMIISFFFTGGCYLTDIEQWLWKKANSSYAYSGGYISHYLGFLGIRVADKSVYWSLVLSLILGLGSYLVRFLILQSRKSLDS